jgi:hypothetical protein
VATVRIALLSLVVLSVAGAPAQSQRTTPNSSDAARVAALGRIRPGRTVRVAAETVRLQGVLLELTRDSMVLGGETERHKIATNEVEMVWERGSRTGTGAKVGLAIGGIAFGAIGLYLNQELCGPLANCHDAAPVGAALGGAVVGGVAGAVGGGLIGLLIPAWHLRFPRK